MRKEKLRVVLGSPGSHSDEGAGLVFRADTSVHDLSAKTFSVGVSPLNNIWESIRVMIFSILPRMVLSSTILDAWKRSEFLVYNGRLRALGRESLGESWLERLP